MPPERWASVPAMTGIRRGSPSLRAGRTAAVLAGLLGAVVLLVVPPAQAQTGYPPGPCTTISGLQNVGNVAIGQHFVLQLAPTCLFTPGAVVTVTVNGVAIPGKVASAGGVVLVDVTVVSATQLSVDDPVLTPAICGTNTVVGSGPSSTAEGGVSTQTATFTITCPATAVVATPVQGRLSLTGTDVLRSVALALALVAGGTLALIVTRRRRAAAGL
jgi:hypothetical protein